MSDIYEKIKIYVPDDVYQTIMNDIELFEIYKKNGTVNKNGFLTTLVINYTDEFESNKTFLFESIHNILSEETNLKDFTIDFLTSEITNNIRNVQLKSKPKKMNNSFDFKLTKKTHKIIENIQEYHLNGSSLSEYFRQMFTSYSLLSRDKREAVIFKDTWDTIHDAIKSNKKIKFKTKNGYLHKVSPFAVTPSHEEFFNYLICEDENADASTTVRSYRINRIEPDTIWKVHETRHFSEEYKPLLAKTAKLGPQFAIKEDKEICVILTEEGQSIFKQIYLQRPKPSRIEGDHYYFTCSEQQVENYFTKLGNHAFVCDLDIAQRMRDKFKDNYEYYDHMISEIES